jgi:arylsulfatase A-like enzyme
MRQPLAATLVLLTGLLAAVPLQGGAVPNPVIIVVMDGLRPDSVVEGDMPNLTRLAREGTFFANHHPVYISSTEVNGTALATGMRPGRSGILANVEYRPEVDPLFPVATEDEWASWTGDRASRWINLQTLPEIVRAQGLRTAVAGTKGVALLWDRGWEGRTVESPTLYGGSTIPGAFKDRVVAELGPIPPGRDRRYFVNREQDRWTTEALTRVAWSGGEFPALSVLWLSEPDYSQHGTGPGSVQSREALRSSDENLGRLLAALEATGRRATTNILVVSDHGFSTVAAPVDVLAEVSRQGFQVGGGFLEKPANGTIVGVTLSGTATFYVVGRERTVVERLVRHLQGTNYAGVIFTRERINGTFALADAGMENPHAPDVVMAMRWSAEAPGRGGLPPGMLINAGTGYAAGQGSHGSLSRFDMNNTLIAGGPAFRRGFRSETPSANSDVAPTVMRLLGLTPPVAMDGRVLEEALAGATTSPPVESQTLQASAQVAGRTWQQYLKVSRVAGQTYLIEGNAGSPPTAVGR